MIDLHAHILPGLDDGAQTLSDSLAMARAAVNEGIDTIVATPHHKNSRYENPSSLILEKVDEFNQILEDEGIPLEVLPGQEIRLHGEIGESINVGDLLPLNLLSGYILVELPNQDVPHYTKSVLYDILMKGFTPIIVHPERNRMFQEQPELLYPFVKHGALTQVTAGSLVGKFGKSAQKLAMEMIETNLTHLISSDAHNTKGRGFFMKEAYEKIRKKFGNETVYRFMENAYVVLNGEMVYTNPPERIKPKKRIGIF